MSRLGLLSSAVLMSAAFSLGPAQAQSRPGWVDPPARQPAQAETPVADQPASGKAGVGTSSAGTSSAETPTLADTPPSARAQAAAPARDGTRSERTPMASPRRRLAEPAPEGRRAPRMRESRSASDRLHIRPRLAETPMASPAIDSDARFPEWAIAATRLTERYLDTVSAPGDAMVSAAPRFYAERVRFHGRTVSLAALMAEKRRFVRRWPERHYATQGGTTRTACHAASATCVVRTTFDFRADNPARGVRSQGVSELTLTISFAGERPLIVAESSRVVRRYGAGPQSAIAGAPRGA